MKPWTLVLLWALLAGCATPPMTPAQERVYAAFDACNVATSGRMRVTSVTPDGRFTWATEQNTETEMSRFRQCLRDRFGFRFSSDP